MNNNTLGRGLGALIPGSDLKNNQKPQTVFKSEPDVVGQRIVKVPLAKIISNPWQPRTGFDHDKLQELAASIKRYGIIQPLVLSPGDNDGYQLIAGERRFKAAQLVGLTEVPAIIRKAQDHEKLELALVENIQRQNLNPLEESGSYQRLMDEFGLTQEEVAERVGKSRSTVANFLRLKNLPDEVKQALRDEKISFSHAKVLLGLSSKQEQLKMMKKIIDDGIPVAVLQQKQTVVRQHTRQIKDPVLSALELKLTQSLSARVNVKKTGLGGTVEIIWESEEDLKRLADRLS